MTLAINAFALCFVPVFLAAWIVSDRDGGPPHPRRALKDAPSPFGVWRTSLCAVSIVSGLAVGGRDAQGIAMGSAGVFHLRTSRVDGYCVGDAVPFLGAQSPPKLLVLSHC